MAEELDNFFWKLARHAERIAQEIYAKEVVEASIVDTRTALPSRDPSYGASRQVERSDDEMEAHLHQVFEHQLGDLGTKTVAAAESILDDRDTRAEPAPRKSTVRDLLRSPRRLRDAIVVNEILRSPFDRW